MNDFHGKHAIFLFDGGGTRTLDKCEERHDIPEWPDQGSGADVYACDLHALHGVREGSEEPVGEWDMLFPWCVPYL